MPPYGAQGPLGDLADVHGIAVLFAIIMAAHGVQDDGEERTIGRDEIRRWRGGHHVVVVSARRVLPTAEAVGACWTSCPISKRHRLVHPRPLPSGSFADYGQIRGSAATHLRA